MYHKLALLNVIQTSSGFCCLHIMIYAATLKNAHFCTLCGSRHIPSLGKSHICWDWIHKYCVKIPLNTDKKGARKKMVIWLLGFILGRSILSYSCSCTSPALLFSMLLCLLYHSGICNIIFPYAHSLQLTISLPIMALSHINCKAGDHLIVPILWSFFWYTGP